MVKTGNVVNIKVIELIKIYNFYLEKLFMWLCLYNSKFEFQKMGSSNKIFKHQMMSDEKVMNIKVVYLNKIYNFYFGKLFMWLCLNYSNLKYKKRQIQTIFWNIKWIHMKKSWTWKLYNSSRCTTFILVISSFKKVIVMLFINFTYLSYGFINYKRDM